MKGKLKKVICMALATTMVVSMTACFGKGNGGDASDALAQASDSANAKEAVFKEWFDNVLVDGEEVIVVWSEYVDVYGEEGGDVMPGGEAVPYEEDVTGEVPETPVEEEMPEEEGAITEDVATEGEGVDSVVIVDDPMMPMPEVEYIPEDNYSFYYKLNFNFAFKYSFSITACGAVADYIDFYQGLMPPVISETDLMPFLSI